MVAKSRTKLTTFDSYLAAVSPDKRAALEKLRKIIKSVAPKAEEYISYGLAAFRLNGKPLVAIGASANHCAFYPMDNTTVAAHKDELKGYETSKGTIRFKADKPLHATLVRKLVKARIADNMKSKSTSKAGAKGNPGTRAAKPVKLLSGGNPQIAKGYGDAPVQAYIAAMPGWKSDVWRRLDALIERTVPDVRKAVKWNSPFYGIEDHVWFLGIHVFAKYIKVAFFRGASLRPLPPGESKQKEVRYLDIHEDDPLDEAQFADWVKQASQLPGERM